MRNQHFITQAEYEEAVKTPLVDTLHITPVSRGCMAAKYNTGFFCDYVVHKIENSPEFGKTAKDRERLLQEGGLQIVTTIDLDASNALMDVANKTIPANDSSGMEIVMASVKPGTGEVLGFGLNRAYDATDAAATDQTKSSMNYAVDQIDGGGKGFPIGSSWKPINLVSLDAAGTLGQRDARRADRLPHEPLHLQRLHGRHRQLARDERVDQWHGVAGKPVPRPRAFA